MEKHTTTSTSRIIICLATILILGAPTAHGDRLKAKLEFTPKTVVPLVTLRLILKCALVPADSKDVDGVVDVQSVVGVSIKQKNTNGVFETVASVSTSNPDDPKLYGDWDEKNTAIDANLHNYARLLEVTVPDPTVKHTGEMQCEIFANDGEAVKPMSSQDTIGYQAPDITILYNELRRLKLENEDQKEKLKEAEKNITDLQTKESTKVSFSAVRDYGYSNFKEEVRAGTVLGFNKALVNIGGGYDTSTGVFTCPVAGTYYIRYDLQVAPRRSDRYTDTAVYLRLNDAPLTWSYKSDVRTDGYGRGVIGNGLVLQLNKGDKLKLQTDRDSRFYWTNGSAYTSTFSGYLLK